MRELVARANTSTCCQPSRPSTNAASTTGNRRPSCNAADNRSRATPTAWQDSRANHFEVANASTRSLVRRSCNSTNACATVASNDLRTPSSACTVDNNASSARCDRSKRAAAPNDSPAAEVIAATSSAIIRRSSAPSNMRSTLEPQCDSETR